ncbi:hypothetical protein D3C86_951400 [compost metagenome]
MFPLFSHIRCPKTDINTFESYDNGTQLQAIQLISKLASCILPKERGSSKGVLDPKNF